MTYLKTAQSIGEKGLKAVKPDDKRLIGMALKEGRNANEGDNAFNTWLEENLPTLAGKDTAHLRAEAIWLADDNHWTFFKEQKWSVQEAKRTWNRRNTTSGSVNRQILDLFKPGETLTTADVAEALDNQSVNSKMSHMAIDGKLVRTEPKTYRLPNKDEVAAPKAKKAEKTTGASWVKDIETPISRALHDLGAWVRANGVPEWMKGRVPSKDSGYLAGQKANKTIPMGPTWKDAAVPLAEPYILTGEKYAPGQVNGKVVGRARGYLVRVMLDEIEVDVNENGESLDETMVFVADIEGEAK